jgi:uncharacterized protein YecE (DUF72 family)
LATAGGTLGGILVGTSGWSYPHWRGPFYPPEMRSGDFLTYYAERFATVEINNSFYRLPPETSVQRWRDLAPPGFTYAVKATRFITHYRRLKDAGESLAQFIDRMSGLDEALGPLLFQLPPSFPLRLERLEAFLESLPARVQVAFEFRESSWFEPAVYAVLERRGAAFCISDLHGRATPEVVTAPLVYVRLHGPGRYSGSYDDASLETWAGKCAAWACDAHQVRVYFDNDQRGYAAQDATRLKTLLGQAPNKQLT